MTPPRMTPQRKRNAASIEGGGVPHRDTFDAKLKEIYWAASIEGGGVPHRDGNPNDIALRSDIRFNRGWGGSPP